MLYEILTRGRLTSNNIVNGTDITVAQLLGKSSIVERGIIDIIGLKDKVNEIKSFIDGMQDFYEVGQYVFVHGWIPVKYDNNKLKADKNYKKASKEEWSKSRWYEWQKFYGANVVIKDKIIVCGHRPSRYGYIFDTNRKHTCCDPFYGNGVLAIDGSVMSSGQVNVVVLEP